MIKSPDMTKYHRHPSNQSSPKAQTSPLLAVSNLSVSFPLPGGRRLRAIRGVSFSLERGEALGLVGESGCGKSTLAHTILLLHQPDHGKISLDGEDLTQLSKRELRRLRHRFQIIFQDPRSSFNPRMTIGQSLAEPMEFFRSRVNRSNLRRRTAELLELVGLDPSAASRYPHELSGGQRQRAAVARALATEPSLLVADEPTSALDVSIQAQVVNLLARLQVERALGLLFISHDLQLVRALCDRTAVMYLGRIVELGPTSEIHASPAHPYSQALLSAVPTLAARRPSAPLRGDVPSPVELPSGCSFRPRCPWAGQSQRCAIEEPELEEISPGRWVACHVAKSMGQTDKAKLDRTQPSRRDAIDAAGKSS